MLEKYENVANFNNRFRTLDYTEASGLVGYMPKQSILL